MKGAYAGHRRSPLRALALVCAVLAILLVAGFVLARSHVLRSARPAGAAPRDSVAMPRGDPSGWRLVFADDFASRRLNRARWRLYSGAPAGDSAGWFSPSHVMVSHGMLGISAFRDPAAGDRWATGGVSSSPGLVQTYGKYLVRFRIDAGVGVSYALLLWPANGSWPPEIDFAEDDGSESDGVVATLHTTRPGQTVSNRIAVDLAHWHTLGVQWLPGSLEFTLDGHVWYRIAGTDVPDTPMVMDMQTQTWACGEAWERCPDARTPRLIRMQVDWVVAYARRRPAGDGP